MTIRLLRSVAALALLVGTLFPQAHAGASQDTEEGTKASVTYIHCGTLIDEKALEPLKDALIEISGEKIRGVRSYSASAAKPAGATLIDLGSETCLPGLIDTHTHTLLQGDQKPGQYDEQILKWSLPYRAIRATQSARRALEYGFTTIRDLETEGAYYADVALRDAINE